MGGKQSSRPDIPWKTRVVIAAFSFVLDASRRSDLLRRFFLLLDPKSPPYTTDKVASSDISVDPSCNLWFRLYLPSSSSSATGTLPLIVYFHGGGFVTQAANSLCFDIFCRTLAHELQSVVVSVNYRLAPNHRYPSQYDDGFDTLKFIDAQNYAVFPSNTDLNRCFLAGDSAGGNIAHHVTLRSAGHEFQKLRIIGLVALQPFFGGEKRTESELRLTRAPLLSLKRTDWMWRSFLPLGSDRDHEAANVFRSGSTPNLSGAKFPATVMVVGGYDPLQDWQMRYYEELKKCGKEVKLVKYPNAIHGFYIFPELPQLPHLIEELREFIRKQSAQNA